LIHPSPSETCACARREQLGTERSAVAHRIKTRTREYNRSGDRIRPNFSSRAGVPDYAARNLPAHSEIPDQLLRVARGVDSEPQRCSYRQLLGWFGETAPSVLLRRRIFSAIDAVGLIATPSLEGLSLDAIVTFRRAAGATSAHDPVEDRASTTSAITRPRALEPEIAKALRRSRAALRVADIPGALEPAPTIAPATTWMQARTKLQLAESHALVVVTGTRMVRGAVTWRSLANSAGEPDVPVTPEPIGSIAHDARLLDALPVLEAEGLAVVLDAQRMPCGPIDAGAALRVLHVESEPYLLIEEIEFHLRALLDTKLTIFEFAGLRG
jgi:hypothetical protein